MYDARGVANFFLERAASSGFSLTVMTLLKILYFAHAWHLAKFELPLVAQPFEAWKYGPVNRVVYDQLKRYGSEEIKSKLTSFDVQAENFIETEIELSPQVEEFLNNIFDYYSRYHSYGLSDLTHEKGSPWDIVWQAAQNHAVSDMVIPDSVILDWFRSCGGVGKKVNAT